MRNISISPLRVAVAVVCFGAILAAATKATWEEPQSARVLSPLNVRSGPGTEYPVVGHAGPGTTIEISQPDTRSWAAVRRGFRTVGYVRALPRYVRVDENAESSPAGGTVWWMLGAVAIAGSLVLLRGRTGRLPAPVAAPALADEWPHGDTTLTAPYPGLPATKTAAPESEDSTSAVHGWEFEKWAARKVCASPFRLLEWRGDKYVDGVFAESTLAPDLVIEYRQGPQRFQYAVECKWRSGFWKDRLWWGNPWHLRRYRRYAAKHEIPVYLLLGVGGSGGNPAEVYLVPLTDVRYTKLFVRELQANDRIGGETPCMFDVREGRLRLLPSAN